MPKSSVTMRRAVGMVQRTRKPIFLTAVLVNGHTIASFVTPQDAVDYATNRFPLDRYCHDYSIQKVG